MKAKVSLLAASLGKPDQPSSQIHHRRGDPMEEPHSDKTYVSIARRLATGRTNAPATRDQDQSLTKLLQERRQVGNPNQRPRTSLA
jgi:hypothetical protein